MTNSTAQPTAEVLTNLDTVSLAEMWHDVKASEQAAEKVKKAAAKLRGEVASELDTRLTSGDVIQIHGDLVGAVRPFVNKEWNVIEYDVTAKAAVLDALRPFLTDDQRAMVAKLEDENRTQVRKLAFKAHK